MDRDLKNTLMLASEEIKTLRRRCEVLQAKVDTMDALVSLVHSQPPQFHGIGQSEDIAWRMDEMVRKSEGE